MTIAYIHHKGRPNYELAWLEATPADRVKVITADGSTNIGNKIVFQQVEATEKGWENLFFNSTARVVSYTGYQKALEDVDAVLVLEVFSSLSRQMVEYCVSVNMPVAVLVYELIDSHPIYRLPRYRSNTAYVLKHASHFIAVSEAAKHHLIKLGAPSHLITVVYPGVDVERFRPDGRDRRGNSFVFVGRLERHKGIDLVIELYKRLVRDVPDLTLSVVGVGSFEPAVRDLERNYTGAKYLGQIPNHALPAMLNRHSVYVMPARDTRRLGLRIGAEQFGFSVAEAMACGLAVVTSDCGALPEIVGKGNVIVRQNNMRDLYEKTFHLLNARGMVEQIGRDNRKLAIERYDVRVAGEQLSQVLNSLIVSQARSPR